MFRNLGPRVDDLLLALGGDEDAFNRSGEAERLGIHLRRGRIYPAAIGHSHTSRLAGSLLVPDAPGTGVANPDSTAAPIGSRP
jgi:hypothetical protein